jgi:predicted nucleic acid-binding protein
MAFVLDASVTMAWFFKDERRDDTDALLHQAIYESVYAPVGWPAEIVNTIMMGERRKRCTQSEGSEFLARLGQISIFVDNSVNAFEVLPDFSRRFSLTAYDAAYLALAVQLAIPLATRDKALCAAALAADVEVL